MQALLSFDKAPPFTAPLRFFLTAPLFGVLAGLLLLAAGPDALASRWMPPALAFTHLVTIGFMLQIMAGALIQILPVVAGANLVHPLWTARIVHAGLSAGALALAGAFLTALPALFVLAAGLLAGAAVVFLGSTGWALLRVPSTSPTIRGLKLAWGGLLGVVALGVTLILSLTQGWSLNLPALTDLHAAWGLGAWAGILLVAIAYVVVPMFQLTPPYPARESWWFPAVVLHALVLWTLGVGLGNSLLIRLAEAVAALAGMGFAVFTLRLQRQRRRARADATFRYWQVGLGSSLAAMAMLLLAALWPAASGWRGWAPLFAAIFGVGGFMSLIIGMVYKIIPFLAWLHLQNAGQGKVMAPNVHQILPDKAMQKQMGCHFAALALLAAAAVWPEWLARPAGAAFVLANGWLAFNLISAGRLYRRRAAEMAAQLAAS